MASAARIATSVEQKDCLDKCRELLLNAVAYYLSYEKFDGITPEVINNWKEARKKNGYKYTPFDGAIRGSLLSGYANEPATAIIVKLLDLLYERELIEFQKTFTLLKMQVERLLFSKALNQAFDGISNLLEKNIAPGVPASRMSISSNASSNTSTFHGVLLAASTTSTSKSHASGASSSPSSLNEFLARLGLDPF